MTGALFVGKSIPSIPGSFFKGSLQDLRISKGIARHTQNFTPSAERPFADTYTKLLLYADSQNGINDRSAANHVFTAYGNTTINGSKYVQPRIIAHINGNHFVIITGMTNDSITYIDPGIGADHQNESVTVTKEGFLKVWQGNVTLENQKLVTSSLQNKTLTATQTQNIRGAFWGSLLNLIGSVLNIFIPGLGTPFQLAALVVSLAEKDWISAIASTFAIVTGPAGTITDAFKNVFHGISQALGNLSTVFSSVGGAISSVYSSVTGFATNLAHGLGSFLHGALGVSSKIGAQIAQTAVSIGVNYGVSKGLETIGVNPQIAGFLGSLTAGAIIGGMKGNTVSAANQVVTQTQNIQSSLQQVITLNQVGRLGMELGLDSGFSNIIGLSMAAIQGIQIQNPNNFQFGQAFSQIRPNLFTSLAQYGVEKLGSAFGLDTRISSLIGAPISGLVDGLQNPGANIIDSINRGILRGGIQLGLEFATQDLDPFIGALSSRAITGAIAGGLSQDHNIFQGIFDAYINSTGNLLTLDGIGTDAYQQALYLSKVIDFTDLINQKGLANALESYATSIFYRDSIEDIIKISGTIANYFQTALTNPQSLPENMRPTATTYNGQPAFLVPSGNGDYLIVSADGKKVLAQSKGANYYEGQFGVDQSGSWVLIKGTMTQYAETGIITLNINNGALAQAEFQDYEGDTAYQISGYSQADIKFDATGALKDAVIVNEISGSEIRIKNGQYLNQSVSNNLQDALKENQPWYEQFNVSKVADFTDQKLDEIANWMLGNAQNNMGWVLTATALNSAKDIIKGAVTDALRFGSSLPGALDDFSNAWEQAKSGNMMSAGYQALLGSGKIFQEIGRATVIVGVVKGLAVSAVESEAKVALASSISEVGLSQGVIDSFKGGNYRTITLQSDVTVYRFVGDLSKIEGSGEGVYLTTKRYIGESTEDLINGLALPPGNDAKYMAEVKIPAGTKIQIGRAAPQPAFANNPEGGFTQLFIDNLEKSKLKFGKIVSKS